MKQAFLVFLFFFSFFFRAQTEFKPHASNFNMLSFTYKHNRQWSAYIEFQQRSIEDFSMPDYYEMKGGLGYNFNKNNQFLIGIGKYGTYRESKFYQRELRIWLQYILSHNITRLKFDHRIRLEKRFFYYPQTDHNINDERYRYRMAVTLPLNNDKLKSKTFFVNTFEELFVGPKEPAFKRNRLFGGFGYQFNDYVNTNIGYMWQKEFLNSGNKNYHFIYLGINFTFDRLKYYETHQIPVAD